MTVEVFGIIASEHSLHAKDVTYRVVNDHATAGGLKP